MPAPIRDNRKSGRVKRDVSDRRTEGRRDRDRLLYSEAFQRLVGVTQVVTPTPSGLITHNRLTHSLKVAQVARGITDVLDGDDLEAAHKMGLDADVVEAASLAHDLGHPPFGHIGEIVLDRVARGVGLREGFEGNAQSFRIVTRLEPKDTINDGLDLTAATRAAILKYPWFRPEVREDKSTINAQSEANRADLDRKWRKFSVYRAEREDFVESRLIHPDILGPDDTEKVERQTLEASIMDLADDITYAMHDLEDFYQARMFDGARAVRELRGYSEQWRMRPAIEAHNNATPGATIARLGAKLARDYPRMYRGNLFSDAVSKATSFLAASVYESPYSGRRDQVARMRSATSSGIGEFLSNVQFVANPAHSLDPYITLEAGSWHYVQVLKHLTQTLVIERPDVAVLQKGQQRILEQLSEMLFDWFRTDSVRLPQRIREGVAAVAQDGIDEPERAVIDYLASLTDHQAYEIHHALTGQSHFVVTGTFLT